MTKVKIHSNSNNYVLFNYDTGKFEVHKYGSTTHEEFDEKNEAIDRSCELEEYLEELG